MFVVVRGCFPCLASLGSHDRGASALVRVAYYINQALCIIWALLGSLRVASKSWSLLAHGERAGLIPGMMRLAQRGVESEEYHLLMFCAL